ncbi:MAG: DUF1822 family protein [Cyanobacteria bacterium J06632_3]
MASPVSHLDLDLEKIYLDIEPALPEQAWQQSQGLANPASRWRAYINLLAMRSLTAWLQEAGSASPRGMVQDALWPTVWEWVTGSAWQVGSLRWVLIPSEAIDDDELRVPQEWVDIPSWAGDYYLLLQVNPDDDSEGAYVKLAGIATHAMLKLQGAYDGRDRTYSLPIEDLTTDINVIELSNTLLLRRDFDDVPSLVTRAAVSPVPELPLAQANQLIQRLSAAEQLNPRLSIGFGPWSALLSHGGWRAEMTRQRQGRPPAFSVNQWLREGLSQIGEQLGWQTVSLQPATVGARGEEAETAQTAFCREVSITGEAYILQVSRLTGNSSNAWRFELRKLSGVVPVGVTLRLLTEDLQPFEGNEATAAEPMESLYVDVALAAGEGVVWTTAPEPDAYVSEILRF